MAFRPAADAKRLDESPTERDRSLARVRKELEVLLERRLSRALDDRDSRRWDELIRLEQELLGVRAEDESPEPSGED